MLCVLTVNCCHRLSTSRVLERDIISLCFEYPPLFKLTLVPLCKVLEAPMCNWVVLLEFPFSLLGHSLMILSKAWKYKTKDCIFLEERGSLFSRLHCGLWLINRWKMDMRI
jgi:hypothetical protein